MHQVNMQCSCSVPLFFHIIYSRTGNVNPIYIYIYIYGDLLDLPEESEDCSHDECVPEALYYKFQHAYLHVSIGCQK